MTRSSALVALLLVTGSVTARAQGPLIPPPYAEYRVDAIVGRGASVQAGGGMTLPLGLYVRLGLIGAAGPSWHDGATHLAGRTDAIARFTLDPFRETAVGVSLGGGVSVPYELGRRVRPYLTAVVDLEGRSRGRLTPALQIGLGGGARIGLAFRASPATRR